MEQTTLNPNLIIKNGKTYRDWWRTQIEALLKFTVVKILDEFGVKLSRQQIQRKIQLEDEGINKIMIEIARLERIKEI